MDRQGLEKSLAESWATCKIETAWRIVEEMAEKGYRFIISRSHHRPKGLPTWRASFCKHHGKANRWFGESATEAICKAAIIALYNAEHPEDRYVQQLNIIGREAEI